MFSLGKSCLSISKGIKNCIISLRLSSIVGYAWVEMISGFRSNVPFFGGSDTHNSYEQHHGGYRPTTAISLKHFCANGGFGAIFQHPSHPELVHYLAPAVCQLNLPHRQHHQSTLMLKILVRPVESGKIIILSYARNGAPNKVTRLMFTLPYVTRRLIVSVNATLNWNV